MFWDFVTQELMFGFASRRILVCCAIRKARPARAMDDVPVQSAPGVKDVPVEPAHPVPDAALAAAEDGGRKRAAEGGEPLPKLARDDPAYWSPESMMSRGVAPVPQRAI